MGRFTLRDEGKTIALGKVLKYKPSKLQVATILGDTKEESKGEETKTVTLNENGEQQIDTSIHTSHKKVAEDLVFDIDSGEMLTKEEYHKRQAAKDMDDINEGDEDDEDEDEEEETT
jgi:hypothetical protein